MISFKSIFFIIGYLVLGLGGIMLIPALVDVGFGDHSWKGFLISGLVTLLVGIALILSCGQKDKLSLSQREVFVLTSLSWGALSLLSALPFVFLEFGALSLTDALFEATSGLTTTGATVMRGLDYAPKGILLWRALLQWFGGIGIILMAMTILPLLHIGGMQLFKTESSDQSEKVMPRVSQMASSIFMIYCAMTLICGLLIWAAGLSPFDALCHALTTLSTGGFSTSDQSIASFDNPWVEGILVVFMVLGGCTFLLIRGLLRGEWTKFIEDPQVRLFFFALAFFTVLMMGGYMVQRDVSLESAFRPALFQVVSILTTTGFTSADYMGWGPLPIVLIFLMSFSGACTGSTSGGIKLFRLRIMGSLAWIQLRKLRRPHGVFLTKYGDRPLSEHLFVSVVGFITLYFFTVAFLSMALACFGLDPLTCLSAATSAISNVGPGVGAVIGPTGTFSEVPEGAKWLLSLGMIAGRLELLTVFVLFMPSFWKA